MKLRAAYDLVRVKGRLVWLFILKNSQSEALLERVASCSEDPMRGTLILIFRKIKFISSSLSIILAASVTVRVRACVSQNQLWRGSPVSRDEIRRHLT